MKVKKTSFKVLMMSTVTSLVETNPDVDLGRLDPITKFGLKDIHSEPLSILVISCQEFCERLKPVMSELASEKYGGKVMIKLAEDVDQILNSGIGATSIDYVTIVCDTTLRNFVQQVKDNLKALGSICSTRLCLVNGSPRDGIEGSALELVKIAERNSLLYINGQIRDINSCTRVAEKLLGLAVTASGCYTGTPFIFPTHVDML